MKRIFDRFFSIMGLLLFSPLLILIGIAIKCDSVGPVFYRGVRAGRFGKPFHMIKFRTMVMNAEAIGSASTPDDDGRITRVGRVLRKLKLDELPQLFNVLRGEMSLVGPRPQFPWALENYTEEERTILKVRPGITDPASIRFRNEGEILRGSQNPDKDYFAKIHPEKMRLSLKYVNNQSLWLDCKILLQTVCVVFFPGYRPYLGGKQKFQ